MTIHKLKLYSVVYGDCTVFRKQVGTSLYSTDRRANAEIQDEVHRIVFVRGDTAIGTIGDYVGERIQTEDQVDGVALTSFGKTVHFESAAGAIDDSGLAVMYWVIEPDAIGVIGDSVEYRIISISHQSVGAIQDSVKHDWIKHVHTDTAGAIQDSVDTDTTTGLWKKLYPKTASWG